MHRIMPGIRKGLVHRPAILLPLHAQIETTEVVHATSTRETIHSTFSCHLVSLLLDLSPPRRASEICLHLWLLPLVKLLHLYRLAIMASFHPRRHPLDLFSTAVRQPCPLHQRQEEPSRRRQAILDSSKALCTLESIPPRMDFTPQQVHQTTCLNLVRPPAACQPVVISPLLQRLVLKLSWISF